MTVEAGFAAGVLAFAVFGLLWGVWFLARWLLTRQADPPPYRCPEPTCGQTYANALEAYICSRKDRRLVWPEFSDCQDCGYPGPLHVSRHDLAAAVVRNPQLPAAVGGRLVDVYGGAACVLSWSWDLPVADEELARITAVTVPWLSATARAYMRRAAAVREAQAARVVAPPS